MEKTSGEADEAADGGAGGEAGEEEDGGACVGSDCRVRWCQPPALSLGLLLKLE